MAKVRLLGGKPLLVGGKVALTDDCCCGPSCPFGLCCCDGVCTPDVSQEECEAGEGCYWLGCTYASCDPNPCTGCNCALDVCVESSSTITCDDGGSPGVWACGNLVLTTSYSRCFSASEIQDNSCLADDSVSTCCLSACGLPTPNQFGETETNGPFVAFHCDQGTVELTNQVAMECFFCNDPCVNCDDCAIGSPVCLSTFTIPSHVINLSDATGTYTFDDHVTEAAGRNCSADIHTVFTF